MKAEAEAHRLGSLNRGTIHPFSRCPPLPEQIDRAQTVLQSCQHQLSISLLFLLHSGVLAGDRLAPDITSLPPPSLLGHLLSCLIIWFLG